MTKLDITIRSKTHSTDFREVFATLSGAIDEAAIPRLQQELDAVLATNPQRIVLETAEVRQIHGGALKLLHDVHTAQQRHGGELLLINKHDVVESIRMDVQDLGGVLLVKLTGHVDLRGVSRIEEKFLGIFEAPGPKVLVDFSTADSLSSLGIRMLLQAIKNAGARGGRVLILNPTQPVSTALETAGLGQFIARGHESTIAADLASR